MKAQLYNGILVPVFACVLALSAGCDNKKEIAYNTPPAAHEGTYKNDKGQVVLEIKGSSLFFTDAKGQKAEVGYSMSNDKIVVESSSGNFTLTYNNGTLTGLPANIAKTSAPLKKDAPAAAAP